MTHDLEPAIRRTRGRKRHRRTARPATATAPAAGRRTDARRAAWPAERGGAGASAASRAGAFAAGGWIAATALDYWPGGNADTEKAADLTLLLATAGSLPTLASGWTDWSDLRGQPRRTGVVHGLLEETAFFLNVGSLLARKKGKRGLGKLLSGTALAAALAGGMLGGELVYGHGVGVKR